MDIVLTNIPCSIVSVDIMDIMGKHEVIATKNIRCIWEEAYKETELIRTAI